MTAKGPRNLNCATSGLRNNRYRWSSAGSAAFIEVASGAGNRRAQPIECAMRAISSRAEMRKLDRPVAAALPGTLPPRTIQNKERETRQGATNLFVRPFHACVFVSLTIFLGPPRAEV